MLFWLFIIIGIVGISLCVIGSVSWDSVKHHFLWYHDDKFGGAGTILICASGIAIIISLIAFSFSYIGINAQVEQWNEQYEALTYKMESGACRDEFGLLSKEVIDEIQDWNTDVVYYQNIQDDFWVGIYYPNIFDQFKTIDYESYNRE